MKPSRQSLNISKKKYWQNHLECWKDSGLSQKQYCAQQLLAVSSFSLWKKKIADQQSEKTHFYPLAVSSVVTPAEPVSSSGLRLIVGKNRYQVELEKDFSTDSLKKLISALESL